MNPYRTLETLLNTAYGTNSLVYQNKPIELEGSRKIMRYTARIAREGQRAKREAELRPRMQKRLEHPASKKSRGPGEENARAVQAPPERTDMADHIIKIL
jgi:hypothetical protein